MFSYALSIFSFLIMCTFFKSMSSGGKYAVADSVSKAPSSIFLGHEVVNSRPNKPNALLWLAKFYD